MRVPVVAACRIDSRVHPESVKQSKYAIRKRGDERHKAIGTSPFFLRISPSLTGAWELVLSLFSVDRSRERAAHFEVIYESSRGIPC